jgi:dTDP-4-amino-4,6-dideoxygalactose transaminase
MDIWERYHAAFEPLELAGIVRRPIVPDGCEHNAHMYYLLLLDGGARRHFISALAARDINAVFHYVPLHSSPAGLHYGRSDGQLPVTNNVGQRLVRLPLWAGMSDEQVARVIETVLEVAPAVGSNGRRSPRAPAEPARRR